MECGDHRAPVDVPPFMEDWTAWSKEELEHQYSPSQWSPHLPPSRVIAEYVTAATRDIATCRDTLTWRTYPVTKTDPDDTDIVMDVYGEDLPAGSGVLVYVHGGYWQELNKDLVGGLMGPLCARGVVVVVLQYTTAPQGRMTDMVKEIHRGVLEAHALAQRKNWGACVTMGWSAGAQLVLQALLQLGEDKGLIPPPASGAAGSECQVSPVSWIRGVVAVSGIFLLTPLVETYVNEPLKLSRTEAWQLSPLNMDNCRSLRARVKHQLHLLIAVADNDSPSFRQQSQAYAQMLRTSGFFFVAELTVQSSDHFRIISQLSDPSNYFSQELLKFIQLHSNEQLSTD
ncbi:Alpha/beta hydrolase fold-3 [Trinorchestia longiramus]|nr:Alpha/beta hydrolase fold-3 [Trinorchestia longiramus]